jgi:ABC-2 type transport system ATP-binding protein
MSPSSHAIETHQLHKVYASPRRPRTSGATTADATSMPSGVVALQALTLEIGGGEFFGVLGPNGAGKTTAISILTTRTRATSGVARVGGHDVAKEAVRVRRKIGVVPQRPNPDVALTVRENLLVHGSYFGVPRAEAARRADALLERVELADRARSLPSQISGGQQQRLMIARALMHDPHILFLDEPTMGLDPQARHLTWELLRELHAAGRTIVLTTHYMEEADRLCDRIAILDHGRVLALDTPGALKAQAPGGTMIELSVDGEAATVEPLARAVAGVERVEAKNGTLRAYATRGAEAAADLLRATEHGGRRVLGLHIAPPSLETLFIELTGRKLQ